MKKQNGLGACHYFLSSIEHPVSSIVSVKINPSVVKAKGGLE
jgi:hypothetical protein